MPFAVKFGLLGVKKGADGSFFAGVATKKCGSCLAIFVMIERGFVGLVVVLSIAENI